MIDPAQRKAALAAVMAVKRGFIDPESAVSLLGDMWKSAGEFEAAAPTQPGPTAVDPVATLSKMNPAAPVQALTMELDAMLLAESSMAKACNKLGLSAGLQAALESMSQGKPQGVADTRKALMEIAQQRVSEMRSHLPVAAEDRYAIICEVARGGMGRILLAMDNAVGREIALKEVLGSHEGTHPDVSVSDPVAVERFLREAKVTGQLDHPNIVPVHEISRRENGSVFYTMKLVRGESMADKLAAIGAEKISGEQRLARRLKLLDGFLDVCQAIAYAHSRGVIHRDLKPHNIMVGDFGETMVLDWGLARVRGQDDNVANSARPGTRRFSRSLINQAGESHTLDGDILGTPAYMSPEQASGKIESVDERSDVYALGAILYEILAGQPPYVGFNPDSIVSMVLADRPPPLKIAAPGAPPDLVSLAEKAMERDRHARLQSAEAMAREIIAYRDGRTLSVYNYSSLELLRRFMQRNKVPMAVSAAAALVILVLTVVGIVNIRAERDTAELNLALKNQAEEEKKQLAESQARARQALVDARGGEIERQKAALQALGPDRVLAQAWQERTKLEAMSLEQRRLGGAGSAAVNEVLSTLIEVAAKREELVRLATDPVAGRSEDFLGREELDSENVRLLRERLLAVELARENGDFALADMLLASTKMDAAARQEGAGQLTQARVALLEYHARRIGAILAEVGSGERGEIPIESERLAEFFAEISSYRESQTVALLEDTLQPLVEKARGMAADWSAGERDLAGLIFRVLGLMRMGDEAAPVLARFMAVAEDYELFVGCGQALCFTRSALAHEPLLQAWTRAGAHSSGWARVSPYFRLVPTSVGADPATAAQFTERGRVRIEKGEIKGGLADLGQALALDSTCAPALQIRAYARARERKWKEAIEDLEQAARLDANLPGIYLDLADARWRDGDALRAMRDCRLAIDKNPDDSRAYRVLGSVQNALGDHADAISSCTRAIELDRHNMAAFNIRGIAREKTGDLVGALVDYTRVVELDPGSAISYGNRANVRLNSGDARGAIEDYTRAIELEPTLSDAYSNRAYARHKAGDNERAMHDCERALKLDGASGWARGVRGMLHLAENRAADAVTDFQDWVSRQNGNANGHYWLGAALLASGKLDDAEREFSACYAIDSARIDALVQRAEVRRKNKNVAGALADFTLAIKTGPAQPAPASLHHGRALTYLDARNFDKAKADFDEAIRLGLAEAAVFSGRGDACLNLDEMDDAIADYTRAIDIEPEYAWALVNRGIAYFNKKLDAQAWDDLNKGIGLDPARALGYVFRGRLRINRKEYQQAVEDFNAAFQRGMDEPETFYWRGLAHQLNGEIDSAILDFNVALRRDSRLKVVHRARGEALLRKRDYEAALKDYDSFLAAYPGDAYAHYRRGMALRYLGRYEDAIKALERSFQLDADRWPVRWGLLITSHLYQGNTDRALEYANRLLARDSTKSDNFALRALVYRACKDWTAAITDYDSGQAIATDTFDKLWNHYGLAAAQSELGNKAEAAANLEKTIEYARGAGDRGTYPLACALALRSSIQADEAARAADMDAAFAQLKIALEKDVVSKAQLRIDFDAAALRTDKRFAEIVDGK